MRDGIQYPTVAILFLASVDAFAANTIDPLQWSSNRSGIHQTR